MIMDAKYQLSNATAENVTLPTKTIDGYNFNTEIAVLLLIAVGIIIINGVVLYLFIKEKTLRTTSNYPLFSLALCDFLCGIVVIPLFTISGFTSLLKSSVEIKFYLGFLVTVLHNFVAIATVYHLVVITAERYMAIKYPLKHLVIRKKRIQKVLVIVWSSSLLISFVPFTWISAIFPVYQPVSKYYVLGFTAFCLLFAFFVPYCFMLFAFVHIFKAINTASPKKYLQAAVKGRRHSKHLETVSGEWRCLLLFAIMAFVFLVSWGPRFVLSLLYQLQVSSLRLDAASQVALLVRYTTSVVNPLLYTFFKRDLLRSFKLLFKRHFPNRRISPSFSALSLRRTTLKGDPNNNSTITTPSRDTPKLLSFQFELRCQS
ncbi:unnamed protein product [Porites evermanni]|uniref:G-protein coupled receptors family 1 profile domain-containing protein n=1 Tax=Porites evermanni TaxID=104178 RepID=A0ABN8SUG3_9CNID|nr:unnamed protein product [Porites evermanni]